MNKKTAIKFIDKNNVEQVFHLLQEEKISLAYQELEQLEKLNNDNRAISLKKQQISKLQDIENHYCNLLIIDLYKLDYEQCFIQDCLPYIETLSHKKSIATIKRYIRSLRDFLIYLQITKKKVFYLSEISKEFMLKFHGDVLSASGFTASLSYPQRRHVYSLLVNLLDVYFRNYKEKSFKVPSLPTIKSDPRQAYSSSLLKILYSTCVQSMDTTIKNYNKYHNIKKKYYKQDFYSLKNLCFSFLKYKYEHQYGQRISYFNRVSKSKHNVNLYSFTDKKLQRYGHNGIDVTDFGNEEYLIWFLETEIPEFPLSHKKIGMYQNYFPKNESVSAFFYKYGNTVHEKYKQIISYKLPISDKMYPFYLYILLITGLNVDTLFSWKNKDDYELGEEHHPLDSNFRLIWGLKKKTNSYIMTTVDTKEKNGLWKYIKFLKKFLKKLHNQTDDFWVYLSSRDYSPSKFNTYSLKSMSIEFCQKNIDLFSEYNLEYVEHLRLRPTKVAYELINGRSIQSIKHDILQHRDIETSTFYTNSREYKDVINYKINEIQDTLLSEAIVFKGMFKGPKIDLKPGYLSYCSNVTNDDCFNYDNCLLCSKSRVFTEHIPVIIKTLNFYYEEISRMSIDKWTLIYEDLYYAAIDCLERYLNENMFLDNNEKEDIIKILTKVKGEYEIA